MWTEGGGTESSRNLHRVYSSPTIITMFESRILRWDGHVKRMSDNGNAHSHLVGELHHEEDTDMWLYKEGR
jgi:hypothetical protein